MTVEKQLKALFNIPDNVQATPAAMAIEFESLMARLEIKQKYVKELYEKYLAEADTIEAAYGGRTVTANTGIAELGFSDKCTNALLRKGINKLGDLTEVSRMSLVREKTIGGDNVARLDRIIGPVGISYKIVEEYQDAGEGVVDDSILEENDRGLRNDLVASDKQIEEEIKERVAQEVEDFKASYKDSMCDDCSYRRAADETPAVVEESEEDSAEDNRTACYNCNETICAETGVCVRDQNSIKPIENAEESFDEDYEDVENETFIGENCENSAESTDKTEENANVPPVEPQSSPFPSQEEPSDNTDFLSFLNTEDLSPIITHDEAAEDYNVALDDSFTHETSVENSSEYDNDINQFLDDLEDEPVEPQNENNPEAFEKSNEEEVFSQIADLIDVEGYEPTVEGEEQEPAPRLEGDVDLFEQPPVYHVTENLTENTFVPPEEDIYTGLEEDVDLSSDDDFEDDYR